MNDEKHQSQFPQNAPSGAITNGASFLNGLNESQREAVNSLDGPLLVLAGAGTGKTRVLTTRLAHLISSGRAFPSQILAVTFTNKAANEMKERVSSLLGRPVEGMAIGTFHSIATRFLRRYAENVGLKPNFTILDTDDQIRLLKQLIKAENIDDKRWPARHLAGLIDRWKNKAITPERVSQNESHAYADGLGKKLYAAYQQRLLTLNACDFGDLILHMVMILQNNKDILAEFHQRIQYILVDEYQDTNLVQYLWLRLLAQSHHNICCVGDDDQSIYGWRGAEIGNILKFEQDYPGAKIVRLEQNYRSTSHILGAASGLIQANKGRLGKTLWTDSDQGTPIKIHAVWDGAEEARVVGEEVEAEQRNKESLSEMAVLVRAGFQTREFEERFITLGVPYRVIGGPRFYERKEIRDALAYIRVVMQPADDLAFERIINVPKRGLGDASVQTIHVAAKANQTPLTIAAETLITTDELRPQVKASLGNLMHHFNRWRSLLNSTPHKAVAETILEESGYVEMWQNDKSAEAPGRLENLQELVRAIGEFENFAAFLDHVALVMENTQNSDSDKISIMTMHGAKGLEFNTVFLPGWEEGVFPSQMTLDESGTKGLEEERRLAYVGLTRAKKKVHILSASSRMVYGQWQDMIPSRFIGEIPEKHVEHIGLMASQTQKSAGSGRAWDWEGAYSNQSSGSSPGWRRAQKQGYKMGQKNLIEGKAKATVVKRETALSNFAIGQRVFHEKFGYGVIEDVEGTKLDVEFQHAGRKKIMDNFVVAADDI